MTAVLQSFEFPKKCSLRASSPIWASEASLPRTRERGAEDSFPLPSRFRRSHAHSHETHFTRSNRRACLWLQKTSLARQAIKLTTEFTRLIAKQG